MGRRRRRALHELRIRRCRYGERCLICLHPIATGDHYYDGGHGRRCHTWCAEKVANGLKREPRPAEVRELEAAEQAVSRAKGAVHVAQQALDQALLAAPPGPLSEPGRLLQAEADLRQAEEQVERLKQLWAEPGGDGG